MRGLSFFLLYLIIMSDVIVNYLENFIRLGNNAFKIIFDNGNVKAEIIRINTQRQLFEEGEDSNENPIQKNGNPNYSRFTIDLKRQANAPYDHITLNDTGEFYKSFTVTVGTDFFIIDANDLKGDNRLFELYGNDVLGLTDYGFEELLPTIQKVVRELLDDL